jgi:hypothetical protein
MYKIDGYAPIPYKNPVFEHKKAGSIFEPAKEYDTLKKANLPR